MALQVPANGQPIVMDAKGKLLVPDRPIIPFIEGDGTGPDIWKASVRLIDAAVKHSYGGKRQIAWMEVLAGEKAFNQTGNWLPDETIDAFRKYLVGIKGPLTTPVGKGIRSLNVALRQMLDLYVCLRPVRYFTGVPSPVKRPEKVDMVIFRENTEDIYAGVEWEAGSPEAIKLLAFVKENFPKQYKSIRFPETSGVGIKPVSREGTERLMRAAIEYALKAGRKSVTIVHKGNIMKFTEGGFRDWSYAVARNEFRSQIVTERETWILGNQDKDAGMSVEANARQVEPGYDMMVPDQQASLRAEIEQALRLKDSHGGGKWKKLLLIRDSIADITLQQVLTRPEEFDVIATLNLNGDYLSDALAAQVGGIGIAPGGNINYLTGHAIFEATHGTAPKYAGLDKVNPGSMVLSAVMMLQHLGWTEAAESIQKGLEATIAQKRVTYDFHRQMDGATLLKCSEFADAVIENLA